MTEQKKANPRPTRKTGVWGTRQREFTVVSLQLTVSEKRRERLTAELAEGPQR
jgi:hypothetical protein